MLAMIPELNLADNNLNDVQQNSCYLSITTSFLESLKASF